MFVKGWVLFMISTLTLSAIGVGYAAWTQALHVEGEVRTGNVNAIWMPLEIEVNEGLAVINPQTGEIRLRPIPPQEDVAECVVDDIGGGDARVVRFSIFDAFQDYACEIRVGGQVGGTVPVRVTATDVFASDLDGNGVLGQAIDVQAKLTRKSLGGRPCASEAPLDDSDGLDVGDGFCLVVKVRIRPEGVMNAQYTAGARIEVGQWNLFASAQPRQQQPSITIRSSTKPLLGSRFKFPIFRPLDSQAGLVDALPTVPGNRLPFNQP